MRERLWKAEKGQGRAAADTLRGSSLACLKHPLEDRSGGAGRTERAVLTTGSLRASGQAKDSPGCVLQTSFQSDELPPLAMQAFGSSAMSLSPEWRATELAADATAGKRVAAAVREAAPSLPSPLHMARCQAEEITWKRIEHQFKQAMALTFPHCSVSQRGKLPLQLGALRLVPDGNYSMAQSERGMFDFWSQLPPDAVAPFLSNVLPDLLQLLSWALDDLPAVAVEVVGGTVDTVYVSQDPPHDVKYSLRAQLFASRSKLQHVLLILTQLMTVSSEGRPAVLPRILQRPESLLSPPPTLDSHALAAAVTDEQAREVQLLRDAEQRTFAAASALSPWLPELVEFGKAALLLFVPSFRVYDPELIAANEFLQAVLASPATSTWASREPARALPVLQDLCHLALLLMGELPFKSPASLEAFNAAVAAQPREHSLRHVHFNAGPLLSDEAAAQQMYEAPGKLLQHGDQLFSQGGQLLECLLQVERRHAEQYQQEGSPSFSASAGFPLSELVWAHSQRVLTRACAFATTPVRPAVSWLPSVAVELPPLVGELELRAAIAAVAKLALEASSAHACGNELLSRARLTTFAEQLRAIFSDSPNAEALRLAARAAVACVTILAEELPVESLAGMVLPLRQLIGHLTSNPYNSGVLCAWLAAVPTLASLAPMELLQPLPEDDTIAVPMDIGSGSGTKAGTSDVPAVLMRMVRTMVFGQQADETVPAQQLQPAHCAVVEAAFRTLTFLLLDDRTHAQLPPAFGNDLARLALRVIESCSTIRSWRLRGVLSELLASIIGKLPVAPASDAPSQSATTAAPALSVQAACVQLHQLMLPCWTTAFESPDKSPTDDVKLQISLRDSTLRAWASLAQVASALEDDGAFAAQMVADVTPFMQRALSNAYHLTLAEVTNALEKARTAAAEAAAGSDAASVVLPSNAERDPHLAMLQVAAQLPSAWKAGFGERPLDEPVAPAPAGFVAAPFFIHGRGSGGAPAPPAELTSIRTTIDRWNREVQDAARAEATAYSLSSMYYFSSRKQEEKGHITAVLVLYAALARHCGASFRAAHEQALVRPLLCFSKRKLMQYGVHESLAQVSGLTAVLHALMDMYVGTGDVPAGAEAEAAAAAVPSSPLLLPASSRLLSVVLRDVLLKYLSDCSGMDLPKLPLHEGLTGLLRIFDAGLFDLDAEALEAQLQEQQQRTPQVAVATAAAAASSGMEAGTLGLCSGSSDSDGASSSSTASFDGRAFYRYVLENALYVLTTPAFLFNQRTWRATHPADDDLCKQELAEQQQQQSTSFPFVRLPFVAARLQPLHGAAADLCLHTCRADEGGNCRFRNRRGGTNLCVTRELQSLFRSTLELIGAFAAAGAEVAGKSGADACKLLFEALVGDERMAGVLPLPSRAGREPSLLTAQVGLWPLLRLYSTVPAYRSTALECLSEVAAAVRSFLLASPGSITTITAVTINSSTSQLLDDIFQAEADAILKQLRDALPAELGAALQAAPSVASAADGDAMVIESELGPSPSLPPPLWVRLDLFTGALNAYAVRRRWLARTRMEEPVPLLVQLVNRGSEWVATIARSFEEKLVTSAGDQPMTDAEVGYLRVSAAAQRCLQVLATL